MIIQNVVEYNPVKRTYSIGDMIVIRNVGLDTLSMIVQTESGMVQAVSLENGNRWDKPMQVKDVTKIDEDSILVLTHGLKFYPVQRATISKGV